MHPYDIFRLYRNIIKTLPFLNALNWSDENTLGLTSIKQLKGCRTTLV